MRFLLLNKKQGHFFQFLIIFSCVLAVSSEPTYAYINPGLGVTLLAAIGTLLLAILFAILGVFLLPYKLLMRKLKKNKTAGDTPQEIDASTEDEIVRDEEKD